MTNRTYNRPYSAGVVIKRPRLRRLEISFDGPPPPTPEGTLHNGLRPHGGVRGSKHFPPGQFSFDKDEDYHNAIDDEYNILLNNDISEGHSTPYWLTDIQREITHSGESPLFTTKLLPPSKFEQEHGVLQLERALLAVPTRRPPAPRRQYLNGKREYYRPNSTHHYLSATDLKTLHEDEDHMIKYGRPTRTTLLRARQRTGSAPAVSSYDSRRVQMKRFEEARNSAVYASKDYLKRKRDQLYNRFCTINAEGESLHSFLTGARYNRAHMIDSRGMSVYGVYMPRDHPADVFITGNRRIKDGEEIPNAPPDSPRSDLDETLTPQTSRPTSSAPSRTSNISRPTSNRSSTRTTSAKTQSYSRTPSRAHSSRPRSSREVPPIPLHSRQHTPKSNDSLKREPLPDEITMAMPDHINKGKSGVYVTLKGQRMIENVDSKLPRVTGVAFPNLRKSRDAMDEILYVNQPPPTPVDVSAAGSVDRHTTSKKQEHEPKGTKQHATLDNSVDDSRNHQTQNVLVNGEVGPASESQEAEISTVTVSENKISDRKIVEIGLNKHVNFSNEDNEPEDNVQLNGMAAETTEEENKDDNVVFFVTEDDGKDTEEITTTGNVAEKIPESNIVSDEKIEIKHNSDEQQAVGLEEINEIVNDTDEPIHDKLDSETNAEANPVITVEISESEKRDNEIAENADKSKEPSTADDFPFTDEK